MRLDLRAALRALRRTPAFTIGAVLTLAVALGLVTTAFGLLFGAFGGDLVSSRDGVVAYLTEEVRGRNVNTRWPYVAVRLVSDESTTLTDISSYTTGTLNLAGASMTAERIDVEFVSGNYFNAIGIAPVLGRALAPGVPGPAAALPASPGERADEILISDRFWRRAFGGAPDVLGQTVRLSRHPLTIVGVLPGDFQGLSGRADVWVPNTLAPVLSFADYFTSEEYFHNVIARLKPGAPLDQARSEMQVLGRRVASLVAPRSEIATARGGSLIPIADARTDAQTVRARLFISIGALLVLLIAAVNVANLVVGRIASRHREFAVRVAVGASHASVIRSVAVEMTLVTAAGLAAALVAATWARDLITTFVPAGRVNPANDYGQLASFAGLHLNFWVVIAVAGLALVTMLLVSVVACRPVLKRDLVESMKRGGLRGGSGPGRAQRTLLAVQVAVSIGLLASAGLLFRTVAALGQIDPGFNASNVLAFSVAEDLVVQRPDAGPALVERLLEHVKRVPGVQSVTVGQCPPYGSRCARLGLVLEGRTPAPGPPAAVGWHRVGPDHFATLAIPVVRGRGFTPDDRRGRPAVVVINEAAAARFFTGQDPIGQRLRLPDTIPGEPEVAEIVGVVGNVIYWPANEPPGPDIYQPALQYSFTWTTVMMRTAGDPLARVSDLRAALGAMDPNLPMFDIMTLEQLGRTGRADRRFLSLLLAACAALGLLLAAIGVYALTASWMEARRRELGVRVALGAQPAGLVQLVMRGTLVQAAVGAGAGVLLALGAGRTLGAVLFGVSPYDPVLLAAAVGVMLIVTASAAYLPARRALRIDPVRELNAD